VFTLPDVASFLRRAGTVLSHAAGTVRGALGASRPRAAQALDDLQREQQQSLQARERIVPR
jgi:hypothetical protein